MSNENEMRPYLRLQERLLALLDWHIVTAQNLILTESPKNWEIANIHLKASVEINNILLEEQAARLKELDNE